jgi:leader peptidase (prepilin peptidase)/N-methyltransferase
VLPATGRCPHCKARIDPYVLAAELVTALVLAVIAVPLAFIDIAVQRLPDLLTISAFAGTLVLLAAAEGAVHQPWPLVRAVTGPAALADFCLALWLVLPGQIGLGDVKLAASIGLMLAWRSWSELFLGALAGALLGAAYARVLSARRGEGGLVYLPLGPFLLVGAFLAIALLPL